MDYSGKNDSQVILRHLEGALEKPLGRIFGTDHRSNLPASTNSTQTEGWRFILCVSGERYHRFPNSEGLTTQRLLPQDGLLIHPNTWVETWYRSSGEALSFVFSESEFRALFIRCTLAQRQRIAYRGTPLAVISADFSKGPTQEQGQHLNLAISLLESDSGEAAPIRFHMAGVILHLFRKTLRGLNTSRQHPTSGKAAWTWRRVLEYLEENYHQPLDRETVSLDLMVHKSHLSRLFRMHGTTFSQHLNELRIRKARELLLGTPELTVSEVAELCGFSDKGYFHRVFKQREGISPHRYRNSRGTDR